MTETRRLYYEDVYKKEFTATVVECRERKKGYAVILDESAFYPEGGGQPSDVGTLGDMQVTEVHEKDGELLHYTDKPLEAGTKDFPKAAAGVKALNTGFETLTANDETLTTGAASLKAAGSSVTSGISQLSVGGKTLASGVTTLSNGLKTYTDGVATLAGNNKALTSGTQQLADGAKTLADGAEQLASGTQTLHAGTQKLVSNNSKLNSGADQLADGAGQIQDGSSKLYDGSKELGDGITKLEDGSDTLATSLNDGAKEVKETNASDDTISMFATPITDEETKITTVENNGHAMAPYMMSVGLWVGCLAFCLMYPLTEYKGKLKSGFAWWASKASVLYPVAILQGVLLILLLHVFDGFTPVEMTKTILFAALTGACFTSIMYFFNITFGKVGSFLMLIFMVVQLAGSAGTYPVEISPSFVAKIHYYLPFTYTVNAFRSTICGGESIRQAVIVLIGLTIIFSILTILQFNHMARRKKIGALANRYLDHVILTELDDRGENIEEICKEIQSEITDIPSIIIPNRAVAVEQAIEQASPGDVVLLLGKGHEKFIALEVGQREYEGDKAIALKAIKRVYEGEEENELQQND